MTTLELSQTVDQVNAQLQSAHRAMEHARWQIAIEQLHAVMNRMHDSEGLRAYVEMDWAEVDSLRASVMMFQQAPPRFRIDLMLQLVRGAAGQLEHGKTDRAEHDLDQLHTILDMLQDRLMRREGPKRNMSPILDTGTRWNPHSFISVHRESDAACRDAHQSSPAPLPR